MSDAIKVTTEVEVSWYDLGRELADRFDYDQAAFLDGFAAGLHELERPDVQMLAIGQKTFGRAQWLIEELHAFYELKE